LLWPLPIMLAGFTFFFGAVVLMRMRAMLAREKAEARLRRRARA
jgi:heme exporter protein C